MEPCSRVAVLSDVHGNAVALAAVLDELEAVSPDLVVFGGDLTWGPLPRESLALARELRTRTIFVRGNAERALSELAGAPGEAATPRERWLLERHSDEERAFLARFAPARRHPRGPPACALPAGMPYEGRAGAAFWAVLGPDVELRRTDYDLAGAVERYRASSDPLAEEMVELLQRPPTPAEVVEDAETAEFGG
jgi:hypothetical protein